MTDLLTDARKAIDFVVHYSTSINQHPQLALLIDVAERLVTDADRLQKQADRFRLERDMLALNMSRKDPCVFAVLDAAGEVVSVAWTKDTGLVTDQPVRFPAYAKKEPDDGHS